MTVRRAPLDNVSVTVLGSGLTADTAAGATTLTVDWTGDFNDTGMLLLNEVGYGYRKTGETTLSLDAPLDAAAFAGDPVDALDANGREQKSTQAWVQLDDGEDAQPFAVLADLEGKLTEDTAPGTTLVVDLSVYKVLGVYEVGTDYTGTTKQIDPQTGEEASAVTDAGDATVRDLTVSGVASLMPDQVDLGGYTLADQIGSQPAGGLRALSRPFVAPDGAPLEADTSWVPLYSMDLPLTDDRSIDFAHEAQFDSTGVDRPFELGCFATWAMDAQPPAATTTDTLLYSVRAITAGAGGTPLTFTPSPRRSLPPGFNRFTWAFRTTSAGAVVRAQGNHRVMLSDHGPAMLEDAGYWASDGGGGGESAAPQTFTQTWGATATRWYEGNDTARGTEIGQFFGYSSSDASEGNRKSAIWFPASSIRAALTGATVMKVEVYLYLADGGSDNVVAIGSHRSTTLNEGWNSIDSKIPDRTRSSGWDAGSARWVNLPASDGWGLDGWRTVFGGLLVGPGPTKEGKYAAGYKGMGSDFAPKLKITYSR